MSACICAEHLDPLNSVADVRRRCNVTETILRACEQVQAGNWHWLARCRECGRHWVVEYMFAEAHGGGWPCAYHVEQAQLPSTYLIEAIRERERNARVESPRNDSMR